MHPQDIESAREFLEIPGFLVRMSLIYSNGLPHFDYESIFGIRNEKFPHLLHIATNDGEHPRFSHQSLAITHLLPDQEPSQERQLASRIAEWRRRDAQSPHEGWRFWCTPTKEAGFILPPEGGPLFVAPSHRLFQYYLGVLVERHETTHQELKSAARVFGAEAQQLLHHFEQSMVATIDFVETSRGIFNQNAMLAL